MMKSYYQFVAVLMGLMSFYTPSAFAQDADVATVSEAEVSAEVEDDPTAGQEVEINEDNYRRFMELRDPLQQRNAMPETAYKSQAQMQKLDKLPEESQKHLRNQLREIIVQGDPWKPGDEDTTYPYVASVAAEKNPSLQKLEAEAWGELVNSYHQREAQIYGNSRRSSAAAAPGNPGDGGQSGNPGNKAIGKDAKQRGEGQQANQENSAGEHAAAGSYSSNPSNNQAMISTAGVSQNALEFLQRYSGTGSSSETADQNSQPSPPNNQQTVSNREAQNALEFLNTQSDSASSSNSEQSNPELTESDTRIVVKQEDAQNALDYLSGGSATTDSTADTDTISIEDLLNAQGLRGVMQTAPLATDEHSNKKPVETPIDKDGGG